MAAKFLKGTSAAVCTASSRGRGRGGPSRGETGYLIDFGEIKKGDRSHRRGARPQCLNEIEGLENPTAELLSRWIWNRIAEQIPCLFEIRVGETCTSECVYRGEDWASSFFMTPRRLPRSPAHDRL